MKITLAKLRSVIREELEVPNFSDVLNKYVRNSRSLNSSEKSFLAGKISEMSLRPGLELERVSRSIPGEVGDVLYFDVVSFTKVKVSEGRNAGHIAWKSSDECLLKVVGPTRGYEVDYDSIQQMFDASNEQEVLLSGKYEIVSKEMITEPGTYPQYGYKVPMFILEER